MGRSAFLVFVAYVLVLGCGRRPVVEAPAGRDAGAACTSDLDCNDDPSVSSLWGQCVHGSCACSGTHQPQPNGKCGPAAP